MEVIICTHFSSLSDELRRIELCYHCLQYLQTTQMSLHHSDIINKQISGKPYLIADGWQDPVVVVETQLAIYGLQVKLVWPEQNP